MYVEFKKMCITICPIRKCEEYTCKCCDDVRKNVVLIW